LRDDTSRFLFNYQLSPTTKGKRLKTQLARRHLSAFEKVFCSLGSNFDQCACGTLVAQLASRNLYFLSCGAREKMQTIPLISTKTT
jgi:hypothetical protein